MANHRQQEQFKLTRFKRCSVLAIVLVAICLQVEAQFFTKSSKSIPRMGRRSNEPASQLTQYRRSLIDALIDEYGPNMVESLQAKARQESNGDPSGAADTEVAFKNDQPVDESRPTMDSGDRYESLGLMSRDERDQRPTQKQSFRDSSLAMRALNINRLIQQLTSGQPLGLYGKLLNNKHQQDGQVMMGSRRQQEMAEKQRLADSLD